VSEREREQRLEREATSRIGKHVAVSEEWLIEEILAFTFLE
jgi:hypothetical protein